MGYFRSVPHELEDPARIGGAMRLQTMFKVFPPLCAPSFILAGVFAFKLARNKILYAPTVLTDVRTVPVATICWFFVERYVVGLTTGAVRQ